MAEMDRRFTPYISDISSANLKKMVRIYGGDSKMRKQECIVFLIAALDDPDTVRQMVTTLEPFEYLALALVKQMGGVIELQALGLALLASGVAIPARMRKRNVRSEVVSHLIERGLLLNEGYRVGYYSSGYSSYDRGIKLFGDPRILAHVGGLKIPPAELPSCKAQPAVSVSRMPPTVALDLIGFLQTIEKIDGFGLTKQGTIRVNDVRNFQKALQWSDDDWEIDGLTFPNAATGLINALRHSDYLQETGNTLVLKKSVESIAHQAYPDQVLPLVNGFLRLTEWVEDTSNFQSYYSEHYNQGRNALLMALRSLPLDNDDFYTIDDFDQLLFDRIGDIFSLRWVADRYLHTYGKTAAEIRKMEEEKQAERRKKWLVLERPWLDAALSSWLYFLGIVELGMEGKQPVSFRLTELGKAVLHPTKAITVTTATAEAGDSGGVWVVQPNFDIIVYLDRTTPPQLAFLERHAERTQAQQYMAHYHLTRESVYQGLESGTTVEALLAELADNAQTPLPQNVTVEIQEWAALREQVILHHRANLLEFADSAARDAALAADIDGRAVGERFLLLAPAAHTRFPKQLGTVERLDYTKPLSEILRADETGLLHLKTEPTDLLLKPQLDQWAERDKDDQWQLTPAGVANATKAGAHITELLELLSARLSHKVPPLLELTLRNWARRRAKALELEQFVVLRCNDNNVIQAIQSSKRLKPYLRGSLPEENLLLFDPAHLAELQEILGWAGLDLAAMRLQ